MRKKILITLWLLIPIALLAYHYGPGQKGLARDQVAVKIEAAQLAEKNEDWPAALEAYTQALAALPPDEITARYKLQLAKAKVRLYSGELPESMVDMEGLLTDMLKQKADAKLVREVRGNLATAQYYAAWLMRLEGASTEEWTVEVEQARQNFRLLAEQTQKESDTTAALDYQKNLEATIRLARMDLSELQSLPLPKKCQGCKNCSQKCRKQRESQCKNRGRKNPRTRAKPAPGKGRMGRGRESRISPRGGMSKCGPPVMSAV